MREKQRALKLLTSCLVLISACESGGGDGSPDPSAAQEQGLPSADGALGDRGVPLSCAPSARYQPGQPYFREVTEEWGLSALEVEGTLLSVADLDGDGWPDLVVRRGGVRADLLDGDTPRRHTRVLRNTGESRFEEISDASGLLAVRGEYPRAVGRPIWVATFADVDNDGDLDAYTGVDTRSPASVGEEGDSFEVTERSELLLNEGDARFTLTYRGDPLRRGSGDDVPSGAAFTDIDRDGWVDLWLTQGGLGAPLQDRLFKNLAGEFSDETAALNLTTQSWEGSSLEELDQALGHSTAWGATACDLNGDGTPELLAASYGRAPNHLWRGERSPDGAVTYVNESVSSGYAFDANQDWSGDEFARCYCQNNPEAEGCLDVPTSRLRSCADRWRPEFDRRPFRLGGNSGATLCADFDGDGLPDLFTSEIRHWWAGPGSDAGELLINQGGDQLRFERPGNAQTGLGISHGEGSWDEGHITAATFDFDNDGRLDIYIGGTDYPGNRGRLFHNQSRPGEPRFQELPVEDFFEHNRSHGVAIADFDRDGDLDIAVGHSRMRCDAEAPNNCYERPRVRLFENLLGATGNWLQLKLEGAEGSNRDAIGAQVRVLGEGTQLLRERSAGYGHFGQQQSAVIHLGLDERCEVEVEVRWPDAALSVERATLRAGQRYRWRQGETPVVLPPSAEPPE